MAAGAQVNSKSLRAMLASLVFRLTPTERQRVLAMTIISGGACGLAAVAFHLGIDKLGALLINRALVAPNGSWIYLTILSPAIGGLIVGLALHYWVPGAVGSGVLQVKTAYAMQAGHVPLRDAAGKFVLGVLQIGSGASLGPEGPTVQICAGISSWLARIAHLSKQSQRRMASVGVAAGIAAAFNAPMAAVTFTLEEVVGDLDQTMLSGVIVAAAIAAVVERGILGQHPVFELLGKYTLESARSLVFYTLLGLLSAVVSVTFTDSLLKLRMQFKKFTSAPKWLHPAVGGALTGALAVVAMLWLKQTGIAGSGYPTLLRALTGTLSARVLLGLCVLKLAATVCSYSSGGVGGLFAPSLFMGGMLGGALGYLDARAFHHSPATIGAFALVGMGAVFAGIIRAPITSVLLIFEMTGGYGLILPMMIANMTAYGLARRWRPAGLYDALLLQDGTVLPHGRPITISELAPQPAAEVPP